MLQPAMALLLALLLSRLDWVSVQVCAVILGLLLLLLLKWQKAWLIAAIVALIYGLLSMAVDVHRNLVPQAWLEGEQLITGHISDVERQPQYTRLHLKQVVREGGEKLASEVEVYLYHSRQQFVVGQQIKTGVKFHLPRNKLNPVAFDYEQYAFTQHISLIGTVSGPVTVLDTESSWLEKGRARLRHALATVDEQARGVLSALLLAERSEIPIRVNDAFAASGASHLLAISGLHVGLVAGWGGALAWWLLTRREDWIVLLPVRSLALIAGVLCATAYATIAGWPIPAQRASLMLLAAVLAWLLRAQQQPLNTMLAALILVLLLDPASVLSISLWLSFIATSALLIWATALPKAEGIVAQGMNWLKGLLWVSLIAALVTMPLIGFIFERFPLWGVFTNILLVPLYALWVLPLALLGEIASLLNMGWVAGFLFKYAASGVHWGNDFLLYIQMLPAGDLWLRGDKPFAYLLLGLTLLICGLLMLKKRYKSTIPLLALTLLMYGQVMLSESEVNNPQFYAWDVGQGASALLRLPGFNLLIDAPGKPGSKFNGGTIAAENSRALGLLHLDVVVLTHAQTDHAGGITRLLASLNGISELWLADVPANHGYAVLQQAMTKVAVRWLKRGDMIKLPQVKVEVLWPPQAYAPSNGNNTSLVLLLTLNTGQSILLPGDMEAAVEQEILADLRAVDLLLVPHHGSKTSSTTAFVNMTRPKIAISQTGYNNFYGFPKEEVVKRYQEVGSRLWNTAEGAVMISFAADGQTVKQFELPAVSKRKQIEQWFSDLKL